MNLRPITRSPGPLPHLFPGCSAWRSGIAAELNFLSFRFRGLGLAKRDRGRIEFPVV